MINNVIPIILICGGLAMAFLGMPHWGWLIFAGIITAYDFRSPNQSDQSDQLDEHDD